MAGSGRRMSSRKLSETEITEARLVFADSLAYRRVRVVEGAAWTNWLARFANWLKRKPPPQLANAVGLGNFVFFPHPVRTSPRDLQEGYLVDMAWLIHELTHAWQFQHIGPIYALTAIVLHLRPNAQPYDYGGADGLRQAKRSGKMWKDFNPEQQGDIARHYYFEQRRGRDTGPWDPFVKEMRATR